MIFKLNKSFAFLALVAILAGPINAQDKQAQLPGDIKLYEGRFNDYYLENPDYFKQCEDLLNKTRSQLIDLIEDSLDYRPQIYIVSDLIQFNQLVSGKFPDWGAAAAIPAKKLIVIKSPDKFNLNKPLDELLAHEYTHLVVSHKSFIGHPPRWLNEGLAMYVSKEWSWSDNLAMSKAAVFGQIIPLAEIEKLNRFNESKAHVAYAESYLAVQYLLRNYNSQSLIIILNQIGRAAVLDEALYDATGMTIKEFEADFKSSLNQQFNWVSLLMDTIFFWLFLAAVLVLGFIMKYKKRRSYYKKWEEEEKYHSTDFDYGDSNNPENVDDDDEAWRG